MVRNQYVYEATNGFEVEYPSDGEYDPQEYEPLHIDDWRDFQHEHLQYMWGLLRQYLYDAGYPAGIMRHATFEDFIRFIHYFSD